MKRILILLNISLFSLIVSAQQFDPFDFNFDPDEHILRPSEVLEHHVASCKIVISNKPNEEIQYDGNGRVLFDGLNNYFHMYDGNGNITTTHVFRSNKLIGQFEYVYDESGRLTAINKRINSSIGSEMGSTALAYKDGILVTAKDVQMHTAFRITTGHDYDYEYNYDGNEELKSVTRSGSVFSKMGDEEEDNVPVFNIFEYKNGVYTGGKEWLIPYATTIDSDGRILEVKVNNSNSDDPANFKPIEKYTYYPNGLVKSKTTSDEPRQYEYVYHTPATFNLNVPESLTAFRIWNYSQYYDIKLYEVSQGQASVNLYVPTTELYIVQLTDEFMLPFIVEPGQTINLTVTNESTSYGETDNNNNFLLEIEETKRANIAQNPDNAARILADMLIESLKKYPEYMGFLFYTELWDVQSEKQLFLDYTEKMIELYPHNFKAHEMYTKLSR